MVQSLDAVSVLGRKQADEACFGVPAHHTRFQDSSVDLASGIVVCQMFCNRSMYARTISAIIEMKCARMAATAAAAGR